MPPYSLSHYEKKSRVPLYVIYPACFSMNDPQIGALIADFMLTCSHMEILFGFIVGALAKTDQKTIHDMFMNVTNDGAKKIMLQTLVNIKFEKNRRMLDLYRDMTKAIESTRRKRNKFAHSLWGTVYGLAESACLIDPRYFSSLGLEYVKWRKKQERMAKKDRTINPKNTTNAPQLRSSEIIVYTKSELMVELENARRSFDIVGLFMSGLESRKSLRHSRFLVQLDRLLKEEAAPKHQAPLSPQNKKPSAKPLRAR